MATSPSTSDDQTPLMKQYWELKSQAGDALLLFRMGDFYELFGDDAVEASKILEITLTSRDKNKTNPMPMAGVPHHSVQGYIQKLLNAGKKVAIGEQMQPEGKGIVKRELVRTFTPGIQFDLEGSEANYLATCLPTDSDPLLWVIACVDASTGETLYSEPMPRESTKNALASLPIRHFLALGENPFRFPPNVLLEKLAFNFVTPTQAAGVLKKNYEIEELSAFLPTQTSIHALGVLISYLCKSQKQDRIAHLRLPCPLHRPKTMLLGPQTPAHLDLPDLFSLINKTRSALGARKLRQWLYAPLKDTQPISLRQAAVRELKGSWAEKIELELAKVYDLERICGRITARLANPRDTLALGKSLAALSKIEALLEQLKPRSELLKELRLRICELKPILDPLSAEILKNQKDDAPLTYKDGGIFNTGVTPDLDRLISLTLQGEQWLIELESKERQSTGIPSLKVRYNRVFGYYIEVTQAHLKSVPSHYQRKQTMVGAERFFTEELKKFEDEILTASIRQKALEHELFEKLLETLRSKTREIMEAAQVISDLDSLTSLSRMSQESGWHFPVIDDSLDVEIVAGRHPMVDAASRGEFVPNDLSLSPETRRSLIITGPNMGGKSTVMRQTALIILLGQIGGPVPCQKARWGVFSSLYTRIGAHDAIARGQSTFMVEMSELAHILHHADERSLIILDEIGRGTSTYDGISVAWATLEWICAQIKARTLFATHYHELTRLAAELPSIANAHLAVEGARGAEPSLRFLYKLKEGPANESFGIHVARIAGIPKGVIDRSWGILQELEKNQHTHASIPDPMQMSLFAQSPTLSAEAPPPAQESAIIKELEESDINQMTPVQALNFVARLQEISRESHSKSVSAQSPREY